MGNNINDILDDLEKNIDLKYLYKNRKINISKKFKNGIKDINKNLKLLNISSNKNIKIHQNKIKNFDSFCIDKKLKKIDISDKISNSKLIYLKFKKQFLKTKAKIKIYTKGINKNIKNIGTIPSIKKNVYIKRIHVKKVGIILLLFVFFVFTLGIIVEQKTKNGYNKLISIKNNLGNINEIQDLANKAKLDFITAEIFFIPLKIIPNNNIKNGYYILEGGKNISLLIDELIQIYLGVDKFLKQNNGFQNIKLTNLLANLKKDFNSINDLLYNVVLSYENINSTGFEKIDNKIKEVREKIKFIYKISNTINNDYENLLSILGHNGERKYLILFQNNDEIRASGGFIGSLATITLNKGKIINYEKNDVYAYEWDINKVYKNKHKAPEGLNKITGTFGLRDSNYFINFKDSSDSINFFLKKINKDVDGIIYLNQNIILDLLDSLGGVDFNLIGEKITKDNFSLVISTLVEAQSFKVGTLGTPKKILFDFSNIFLTKLLNKKKYGAYLNILIKNIISRDLVFYSFNSSENNLLWKLGVNGKINYNKTLDYNYPVFTSIGGNKSDRYIENTFTKKIIKNPDCSIDTNIEIKRSHFFTKNEEDKVNLLLEKYPIKDKTKKDILNIQGKGTNKSYVRLLLPKDIIVKPKKGLKIKYNKKNTIVEFYTNTRQLETTKYNIEYKIKNRKCRDYEFIFYKQPGIKKYNIIIDDNGKKMDFNNIDKDFLLK